MSHALAVALVLAVLCCDICVTIRVPVVWDGDSEVTQTKFSDQEPQTSADKVRPQKLQETVPIEYFQYTAKKPQFAVDIAKFHGVQSPQEHYKAYPVRPYTGKQKPELGRHRIQDPTRPVFQEFQQYLKNDDEFTPHIKPVSHNYEVFHPYKAEEPGFQELYKDPILDKIRNDIRDSSQRLQTYENEAGKPNIESGEYLESADETDRKKIPQRNIPAPYEIHRPQRRPVYYRPAPRYPNRDEILNKRFRHPWNQNFVKIRPAHYVPLQNHLHRLRQHHALKYDDERNEYPQVPVQQHYEEPSEGYDIYEKGKAKYVQLRNNLDESVNNVAKESRPSAPQKLELQASEESEPDEDDEFVPVKNYAQVRKTETTKHLPKSAAFDDADSYEEIRNAPRLREAIKSSKAQTVYTEEGYEDSAYDHAGEQKHASDHEAHAGYLKENELSGGKYKAPSFSGAYDEGDGSTYKNQKLHGEKWKDDLKENQKEKESEDYAEDEHERYIEADSYERGPVKREDSQRNKRQEDSTSTGESENIDDPENVDEDSGGVEDSENVSELENDDEQNNTSTQHDVNKRETKDFKVPVINLDAIFTSDKDVIEIVKQKIEKDDIKEKYPYYFKNLKAVNEHSPLRYAENLKFIPKKSKGGTEFYDSRAQLECPEVDENVDAIPDKLKKNGHPDANEETDENPGETDKQKGDIPNGPRLSGLGDKIDCFKAKYFGRNPLDSPFFKEEIISNPEPPTLPDLTTFKLKKPTDKMLLHSAPSNIVLSAEKLRNDSQKDIFELLHKLNSSQNKLTDSVVKGTDELKTVFIPQNLTFSNSYAQQNTAYNDILEKIKAKSNLTLPSKGSIFTLIKEPKLLNNNSLIQNVTHDSSQNNKEIIESATSHTRKKRASPFVYEPYKIIRDVQVADTKKTTTTSNISPLIKQLQSSKVIDTVVKDQPVKRTANSRTYKDIGRKDRAKNAPIEINDNTERSFIDVNSDKRRGEPRYELKPSNHKSQYSPVNNKKSMSREDYEAQTKEKENTKKDGNQSSDLKPKRPAPRALYDISRFIPKSEEIQKSAASNTVKTTVASSTPTRQTEILPSAEGSDESEEDYDDEYEDEEEEQETSASTTTTTTTTTTPKPIFRRRMRPTTTTEKEEEVTEEPPKLRLVTRFRTPPPSEKSKTPAESPQKLIKKYDESEERPKYREKKKKSSKSTLVTDTKKYGDDNDDMRKEEIDALIGVKHDMDEYTPMYEKEAERKRQSQEAGDSEEDDSSEEIEDEDEDDDDDDDDNEDDDDEDEDDDETTTTKVPITTTEGPKRTLSKTTDAPPSTTETRKNEKLEVKPVIVKKKIEIHKELPVNQSSPHVTQYKQDIEEEEIIKEIPRKIPEKKQHKDIKLLDFYKDENLAKDINQLGGVEVFKENLDLKHGPKHGGNYRRAPDVKEEPETTTAKVIRRRTKPPKDAVASQTENKKHIELNDDNIPARRLHGGNLKSISDLKYSRGDRKSEKLIELTTENYSRAMHGGNLKSIKDRGAKRFSDKSAKLIELDSSNDDDEEDDSKMHGGNFKSSGSRSSERGSRLHGGNYRSAKLIAADNEKGETQALANSSKGKTPKNARANAAVLLNSFAQAAPIILTTTPAYILDPSKRMYYYVDA